MSENPDGVSYPWWNDVPPPHSADDYGADEAAEFVPQVGRVVRPLPMFDVARIMAMKRPDWLVKGIVAVGGLSVWYGPPGCGKSFLLTHVAMSLALGVEVFGRRVKQGSVIYVAGEGASGFRLRLEALRRSGVPIDDVPFRLVPVALDLVGSGDDVDRLLRSVEAVPDVAMIIVDTVARSLGGAEENDAGFGALIKACDRIRTETGAHVALVHHSGKDAGRGPRGHSSLLGAVDTAVEISRDADGIRRASIAKQKDGIEGDWLTFDLQTVELGIDEDGDPVTSCIVAETNADRVAKGRRKPSGQPAVAYHALESLLAAGEGEAAPVADDVPAGVMVVPVKIWRENALRAGLCESENEESRRKAFHRGKIALVAGGWVGCREIDGIEIAWMAGHVRDKTGT